MDERPRHHFLVVALIGLTMALAPIMLFLGAVDAHLEGRYAATLFEVVVYGWIVVLFMRRHDWHTDTLAWHFALMMVTLGVGCSYWYINDPLPHLFIITAIPVAAMMLGWRGALTMATLAIVGLAAIGGYFMWRDPTAFDLFQWSSTSVSCLVVGSVLGGAAAKLNEAIRAVPDPVTIRDFERERELERQLAIAERDRALGALARAVAHDFNNLLTPIIVSAEMARMTVDDPEVQEDLSAIMLAGSEARELVRTVLDFQRRDSNVDEVDLGESTRNMIALAAHGAGPNLSFQTELSESCIVRARPSDIQRIVMNLVTNASRATKESGTITVRVHPLDGEPTFGRRVAGEHRPDWSYVALEIADDGPGISAEKLETCFEPFVTYSGGTGLGLSTVREIVEDLGGGIWVETAIGQGTRFCITMPTFAHRSRPERSDPPVPGSLVERSERRGDDLSRGVVRRPGAAHRRARRSP